MDREEIQRELETDVSGTSGSAVTHVTLNIYLNRLLGTPWQRFDQSYSRMQFGTKSKNLAPLLKQD